MKKNINSVRIITTFFYWNHHRRLTRYLGSDSVVVNSEYKYVTKTVRRRFTAIIATAAAAAAASAAAAAAAATVVAAAAATTTTAIVTTIVFSTLSLLYTVFSLSRSVRVCRRYLVNFFLLLLYVLAGEFMDDRIESTIRFN